MDHQTFVRLVREALDHLSSRSYLTSHRLASVLAGIEQPLSGDDVRCRLIDAIEQLRPIGGPESSPPDWRRYRHLMLRYVEGHNRDQVATELGVSYRQASRDHEQAIDALASLIWTGLAHPPDETRSDNEASSGDLTELGDQASLSEEMNRAFSFEGSWADLAEASKGTIATLGVLLSERKVSCQTRVPDTLPRIAVTRTMLRQILLTLLSYVVEVAPGADIELSGVDSPRGVILTIDVHDRGTETLPSGATEDSSRALSTKARELRESAEALLRLQGGALEPGASHDHEPFLTVVLPPVALFKVLVVDDNPDVAGLFRRYLRGQPYRLIQATSGESAIQLTDDLRPDVVILDVMLPSADGWEVLAELRRRDAGRRIPTVVCSILPEKALAHSLGVDEFLAKPVTREALLAALRRCVLPPGQPDRP